MENNTEVGAVGIEDGRVRETVDDICRTTNLELAPVELLI